MTTTTTETKRQKAARISAEAKAAKMTAFEATVDTFVDTAVTETMSSAIIDNNNMLPTVDEYEQAVALKHIKAIDRLMASLQSKGLLYTGEYAQQIKPARTRSTSQRASSTATSPVATVWAICIDMMMTKRVDENNVPYTRKNVVQACIDAGININTAKTQIQLCLKAGGQK